MTPILEDALLELLERPPTTIDTLRNEAAQDLEQLTYGVYIGSRPQGSEPLAIVIERAGGTPIRNTDKNYGKTATIVDLTFWSKDTESNRANVRSVLELMHLVQILLVGLITTTKGVTITSINVESEPFTADESPRDKSDGWTSRFTMAFEIYWRRPDSSLSLVHAEGV